MAPNGNGGLRGVKVFDAAMAATASKNHVINPKFNCEGEPLNMKLEKDRLKTFTKWPVSFINKSSMAATGFYYVNKMDIVRCAYCSVEVGCWEEGDVPEEEHKRWAPSCPVLRGLAGSAAKDQRRPMCDIGGLYGVEIRPNSGPENGKHTKEHEGITRKPSGPRHRLYASYNARMNSFNSWPKSLKPRPEELTEAGFFYSGNGDQTICFYCGGGLKDWKPTDDPWVEHCKWFPHCTHVVLHKSKEFREEALARQEPLVSAEEIQSITKEKSEEKQSSKKSCSIASNNLQAPSVNTSNDSHLCKLCFQEQLGIVFLPCGHLVSCVKCAGSVSMCPVCQKPLNATVRAFVS